MRTIYIFSIAMLGTLSLGERSVRAQTNLAQTTNAIRSFATRGVVREKPASGKTLVIRHDEIPGYMPKMTMELTVKNTNEIKAIAVGDQITFDLVVNNDDHYIEQIRCIGISTNETEAKASVSKLAELQPGDLLPDTELVDENGQPLKFSDFRGQALAFTFIFTRCPLPDFCPRMGKNFSRSRELLLQNVNRSTNWQFLSISFDAEFDRPAVLKSYARNYRADNAERWRFAAAPLSSMAVLAPELDFRFSREAGSFSHNLRTVVLDTQGRIHSTFDGNRWTAEQLAAAVQAASVSPKPR